MQPHEILALYDREIRQNSEFPDARREVTPHVVRYMSLNDDNSYLLYSALTDANADAVIQAELAYFQQFGKEFEWKLYDHDQPTDLKQRLEKFGFTIGEVETFFALEIESAPAFLLAEPAVPVTRITDAAKIPEIMTVQQAVWPEDDYSVFIPLLQHDLETHPDLLSMYAVYMDGKPVSSAWTYFQKGKSFAGIFGGATLPDYRKRGIYTALVAARVQEAKQRGVRFLTIDASPMSGPIVEKLGFQFLDYTYPCTWQPNP